MQQRYFLWLNGILAIAVVSALISLFFFQGTKPANLDQPPISPPTKILPKSAFQLKEKDYEKIKGPFLDLNFVEPNLSLPDLRNLLTYYGTNKRPDASAANQKMYFAVGDTKNIIALNSGEKVYLVRNEQTNSFQLSPQNKPTALWITAKPLGKGAAIDVFLQGVNDAIVREPRDRAQFRVDEKQTLPQNLNSWNLGANRVDGTLLLKQKAKWYGPDLLLELYGGPDYQTFHGKQRIHFGEGDEEYSVFVSPGDVLIWKEDRWQMPEKEEKTQNFPILQITKIDDRVLATQLWDVEGKTKVPLNIIRILTPIANLDPNNSFQFLGARTRVHYMFSIDGKREIVGAGDWFVMVDGRWQKVKKTKEIDQIVSMQLKGPLLILDRLDQTNRALHGKLFNATHSDMIEVEIPLVPANMKPKVDEPQDTQIEGEAPPDDEEE